MFVEPTCFEIELKVKIISMKNPSFEIKPLQLPTNARSIILYLNL